MPSFLWKSMLLLEGGEWQRGVLLMSFHFSTSVLLFRGFAMQISLPFGYWCFVKKEELFCGSAFCSAFLFFLSRSFSFFFSYLEPSCQEKEEKKNQQRGSIRSNSVYEVFSLKHLRKSIWVGRGMRPNCSQSLLILPVQSPHRAERERGVEGRVVLW